jgi:hypothetical protein
LGKIHFYFDRISTEQGRLHFSTGHDFSTKKFSTKKLYNDFEWHKVRIERNPTRFVLLLDGEVETNQTADLTALSSNLQLGGFPNRFQQNSITDYSALVLYLHRR